MACFKLQLYLYIISVLFPVLIHSQGRKIHELLINKTIIKIFPRLSMQCFLVPTAGCEVISSEGTCYNYFTSTGINGEMLDYSVLQEDMV